MNKVKEALNNFEGCLEQFLRLIPEEKPRGMARYALFPAGKRIRPHLIFAISNALSITITDQIQTLAAAVELLHSSSLVHDDLPALDNDFERRGKPTLHVKYGEGLAVLVGDLLLNLAFYGAAKFLHEDLLKPFLAELGNANTALILGQLKDIENIIKPELLPEIHCQKTGALFAASAYLPTLLATSLSESDRHIFKSFGLKFGLLFQYVNDLNDIRSSDQRNGRVSSSDPDCSVITNALNDCDIVYEQIENLSSAKLIAPLKEVYDVVRKPAEDYLLERKQKIKDTIIRRF